MKNSKNNDSVKKQKYSRLLKYAAPYKFRLAVGIIAGLIVGGSLFGSLLMIPKLMMVIPGAANEQISEENKEKIITIQTICNDKSISEKEKQLKLVTVLKGDNKFDIAKQVKEIKAVAKKVGIELPIRYDEKTLYFESSALNFSLKTEDEKGALHWQFFSIFVFCFVILWATKNLATYINRYFTRWVGTRVVADLRNEVFSKLLGQSLKFYGKMDVGQLISRCTNDTAAIESAVAHTIADATRCPIEIGACFSAILYFSIQEGNMALPIIIFIGLPLCVLPLILVGRRIRKIYREAFRKIAAVVSRMHEVFSGIIVVKAYHAEEKEANLFKAVNRKYFRTVISALKMELLMAPLMETVAVGATLVFFIYSYSEGVTLISLANLLVPAFMAYQPIKKLAKIRTYIERSMAAADRYFELIDTDTSLKEIENPIDIQEFNKEIEFNNTSFCYDEGKTIVDNVSFKIPKGDVVAVVGETGSGKTTIASLLARFYDASDGSVTIDGNDVRNLKISSLRDIIGVVTQETIIFNDTISSNIAYGKPDASQEEIEMAAKQANAHQFIVDGSHKDGYDTIAGEKGFNLSGGEKQRIAIARAILKNPPILILDEATSALDTVTEKLVQDALNHLMENRTVFAIAHRLSTIQHADKILVLDKGKIVEAGTHDELIAKNGSYKKFVDQS